MDGTALVQHSSLCTSWLQLVNVKTTDQTGCDGDTIRAVQKTGKSRKGEKAKEVTGDACNNEDAGGDEDDDEEYIEDRDPEWVSRDEVENSSYSYSYSSTAKPATSYCS
jgi:hypothetical protein